MRIPLALMWQRTRRPRKRIVTARAIKAPSTFATDLYQIAYADIVALWANALEGIFTQYERSLADITTDAPADIQAEIGAVERNAAAVIVTVRVRLERWAARIERWQRARWRGAILSATGVDLSTWIGPADVRTTIEAAIEANVSLVKSISDEARQRIAGSVFRGLNERKTAREVGREISEAVGMARRRARNVAADQLVKISAQLNEERRRQAGINQFEWVHSDKRNPRPEHVARDGKVYSDDDPPADMPGQRPYCGCTSKAVLDLDAMLAELDLAEAA